MTEAVIVGKLNNIKSERFGILSKYVKDTNLLLKEKKISFEELKSATIKAYGDVRSGKMDFNTFSWVITALIGYGVWESKGFGEVYKDRNLIKALETIADPVPYVVNPTKEQQQEMILKGSQYLKLVS